MSSASDIRARRHRWRWLALAVVLGLGILEALGRLIPTPPIRSAWTIPILLEKLASVERDPVLFWRLPGRGAPSYREGARHRVLCLADSVTVMDDGHGYPELLEALLDGRIPGGVSVWNAGVPGYTTEQALRFLDRYSSAPAPELATIQLAWNDHTPALGGHPDHEVVMPPEWALHLQGVLDGSGLYQLLRRAAGKGAYVPGPGLRVPPERYEANLRALAAKLRERGATVVLVTCPFLSDHEDYTAVHVDYNQRAARVAGALGVALVDPVPRFIGHRELFLRPETDHVHFNPDGSRIIAEMIVETLDREGWIGAASAASR